MNPKTVNAAAQPFWETTALADMTRNQWESLCDGCARCCLHKLQDRASGRIYFTMIACRLLDRQSCRCKDYRRRATTVPGCLVLSAERISQLKWLPSTCAYRKLAAGQPLEWWHPLVSGERESVHRAGVSIQGLSLGEEDVHPEEWPRFILDADDPPDTMR